MTITIGGWNDVENETMRGEDSQVWWPTPVILRRLRHQEPEKLDYYKDLLNGVEITKNQDKSMVGETNSRSGMRIFKGHGKM